MKWEGGEIKLKVKYEIVKSKIEYKEKFQINLLGKIVNKQNTTNLYSMCHSFSAKESFIK